MPRQMKEMKDVSLLNKLTSEVLVCDILGEDTIDGKVFWIAAVGARVMKLSKEGFELKRRSR